MNNITVDIFAGNWVINTAVVGLEHGKIVDVKLLNNRHHPVDPRSAEIQRDFWTREHEHIVRTSRVGAVMPTPDQIISKAIGTLLVDVDHVHQPEDAWLDSAFEDRMEMAGF